MERSKTQERVVLQQGVQLPEPPVAATEPLPEPRALLTEPLQHHGTDHVYTMPVNMAGQVKPCLDSQAATDALTIICTESSANWYELLLRIVASTVT
jgi:hypothetical protein